VVGIPDPLKGHLPFAFVVTTSSSSSSPTTTNPDDEQEQEQESKKKKLFTEIQTLVRSQVGPIASLGGMVHGSQGRGMIPKTRSGKTLRRVLRELVENAVRGEFDNEVAVPSTVEDASVVEVARERVREYFLTKRGQGTEKGKGRAKL
jgi:propionyl-CoA synthetase